jgi:hypothetical protein
LGACVTLSQAAAFLGITRQGAHDAIRRGQLAGEVREVGPGGIRLTWIPVAGPKGLRAFAQAREAPRRRPKAPRA